MPSTWPTDNRAAAVCPSGLYVVATPIGNLEDITLRAIRILSAVDLIAAEDTRHTARLLAHHRIRTAMISCHEHNEHQRAAELIAKIRSGTAVALVSDAGTPSVSDPGYRLVHMAIEQGVAVFPIPGVSAAITALCASGLPTDAFVFQGFAPKKKGKRLELLRRLVDEPRTLVFYESPRRTATLVEEIYAVMGDRQAVLARELTKLHEEFIRGSLAEIMARLADRPPLKGECTLLVDGATAIDPISDEALSTMLKDALTLPDAHLSTIAKTIAQKHHLPRKRVYDMALKIQKQLGKSS